MTENSPGPQAFQFGVFELNLKAGELRKQGAKIKLQEQPLQVLRLLLEHAGDVVTKEELQKRIWPSDTFVDFDHGLHSAVTRLREALGDSSEIPRFIETLARRGYRFIAPVRIIGAFTRPGSAAEHEVLHSADRLHRFGGSVVAGLLGGALLLAVSLSFDIGGAQRWLRRQSNRPVRSLAVLPLQNLSGGAAQDYFADGMTEALTTSLGTIGGLRVVSRTSAMRYKGGQKTLPEIARELNVDAVVEGAVLRSGNRVRITTQLVEGSSDRHLWAGSYERDLRDVLALQSDVAEAIVREINIKISAQQRVHLASTRTVNPEAHDAYLRGRYTLQQDEGWQKSQMYFQRAIDIDPGFALAYSGLADYYFRAALWVGPPSESMLKTKAFAEKALQIDESIGEAHNSLARVKLFYEWDFPGAEKESKRALELNPSYAPAHYVYSRLLGATNRTTESLQEARRAMELNPFIPWQLGLTLMRARQFDDAVEEFRQRLKAEPDSANLHHDLSWAYELKGMYKEAVEEEAKGFEHEGKGQSAIAIEHANHTGGYSSVERWRLEQLLKKRAKQEYVSPLEFARIYAWLGEKDNAFAELERAYEQRAPNLFELNRNPSFDSLHSDPRFKSLARRIGIPEDRSNEKL